MSREWRGMGHRAVTEGVNLAYVAQMRRTLYAAADAYDALLAELKQAEQREAALVEALQTVHGFVKAVREHEDVAEGCMACWNSLADADSELRAALAAHEQAKQ